MATLTMCEKGFTLTIISVDPIKEREFMKAGMLRKGDNGQEYNI